MLQYDSDATRERQSGEEEKKDEQLEALAETSAELLADICLGIQKVKLNSANFTSSCIKYLMWRSFL